MTLPIPTIHEGFKTCVQVTQLCAQGASVITPRFEALTLSAFIILSIQGVLPWWFTILVAIRELGITVMRAFFLRRGIVVSASQSGKIKTVLQVLAIFLLLIPWDYFYFLNAANRGWASVALMSALCVAGTALAATLWSGIAYVREGLILAREVRDSEPQNEA